MMFALPASTVKHCYLSTQMLPLYMYAAIGYSEGVIKSQPWPAYSS